MNSISIPTIYTVPTTEVMLEEETMGQKRRNLIERIRKLGTRLSYMHSLGNENKRKLIQQYQQNLRTMERALLLLAGKKTSRKELSKVEVSVNTIEERISVTDSIFCHMHMKTVVPAFIDLTIDDDEIDEESANFSSQFVKMNLSD